MARGALVFAAVVLAAAVAPPSGHAQPAPALARARDLYASAEAAMKAGRFEDAARDYGAAYELSKDPALFFKIGRAAERGGKCAVAVTYYARYLREGHPTEQFAQTTRERIAACGGDPAAAAAGVGPAQPGSGNGNGNGAAAAASGTGTSAAASGSGSSAAASGSGTAGAASRSAAAATGTGSGAAGASDPAAPASAPLLVPTTSHKVAWILTGSAIALASLGGILAVAARSSEDDVRDLYLGFAGQTPAFDSRTRKSYDDLVTQGHRYEHLSWAAFGVAGAAAVGAVVLFATGGRSSAEHARITPVVAPTSAGVAVRF